MPDNDHGICGVTAKHRHHRHDQRVFLAAPHPGRVFITRVLPETKAQNLTVLLQLFGYVAFSAGRYPASIVEISGLTAPAW